MLVKQRSRTILAFDAFLIPHYVRQILAQTSSSMRSRHPDDDREICVVRYVCGGQPQANFAGEDSNCVATHIPRFWYGEILIFSTKMVKIVKNLVFRTL